MSGYIMELRKVVGHRPLLQVGASVIVEDKQGRILLQLRNDNRCWGYAGGSVELDEEVEEAAKRELLEETGLVAEEMTLFGIFSGKDTHYIYPNGDEVSNIDIVFLCKKYSGTLKCQEEEVKDLKFFAIGELPENISPPVRKPIQKWVERKTAIAYLFRKEEPKKITIRNSSRGENDFREALFVEYEKEKLVIKLADNGFTDETHLAMWATIAQKYKELGYYCPQFEKALDGTFPRVSYAGRRCIAYAEEYSLYRSADEIIREKFEESGLVEDGYYRFLRDAVLMNARVAAKHYDFTELPSAYCMFETFEAADEVDEVTENAMLWKKEADKLPEQYQEQVTRIWNNWLDARAQLREIYSQLPTSVFQADINDTNVLLDEDGNFKGIYDFNIGGKEVFMNLIFREAPYVCTRDWEEFDKEDHFSRSIKKVLKLSSEVYEFNELEKKAAPLLYRCIKPLYWQSTDVLKEAGNKESEIQKCLDFIEYEQTREIDFWGE